MNRQPDVGRQSGIVLVTALILLIVMTLLALSSARIITQQERMAAYSYDRGIAFQSAEAALRRAEILVEAAKPTPASGACSSYAVGVDSVQVCPPPGASETRWTDTSFTGWVDSTTVGTGTLAITPKYFVEYLGNTFPCTFDPAAPANCKRYRITAQAGGTGRAAAMVQSVYATE